MYTIYVKFTCLPQKREAFIQKVKDTGILAQLEELGIEEGDSVRMYGLAFDYYK